MIYLIRFSAHSCLFLFFTFLLTSCATTLSENAIQRAQISYDLGVTSFQQGDNRSALRDLLAAVTVNKNFAEAHNVLGIVYHTMGKPLDALSHYETALTINPQYSEVRNNRGSLLIDLERYPEAIADFEKALADILYETPSLAEGNMGWAYYKMGKTPEGLNHLHNATALNPNFCRGYMWIAQIGTDKKLPEESINAGKKWKKYCLNNPEIRKEISTPMQQQMLYNTAQGYLLKKDLQNAAPLLTECIQLQSESDYTDLCQQTYNQSNLDAQTDPTNQAKPETRSKRR